MIDWLKFVAPLRSTEFNAPANGGNTISLFPTGEIDYEFVKPLRVVGSHDSSLRARAIGDGMMVVDGNPSKFFQGHNVYGPECVRELAFRAAIACARALNVEPIGADLDDWAAGNMQLKTVDCTYSIALASRAQVLALLKQMEMTATMSHRGRGQLTKGSTLYFGKNSRRSAFKLYSKGEEINAPKHQLNPALLATDFGKNLLQYADPLLRTEVRLHSKELQERKLDMANNWSRSTPRKIHQEFWKKLNMTSLKTDIDNTIETLPNRLKAIAKLHLKGEDTRNLYSRSVWYRARKELLKYDIDLVANTVDSSSSKQPIFRKREVVELAFDYNNQIPAIFQGTDYDPERFQSARLENDDEPLFARIPYDIAAQFPDHFSETLDLAHLENQNQMQLFH